MEQTNNHQGQLLRWATYASVSTAAVLIALKLYAWYLSDSVAILASLVDSVMDIIASLVNLVAVAQALKPADDEHRFGHGKVEALAGLGQSAIIGVSALFLVYQSVIRLNSPQTIDNVELGTVIILISIALTAMLLLFQRYVVNRTGSTAVKADALHYRADLITNASILVALLLSFLGFPFFDPIFALAIAAYILYSAAGIAIEASQMLIDRELPQETQQLVESITLQNPKVLGIHELRTRRSGLVSFIQLHIDLDKNTPLQQAHDTAEEVEFALKNAIDNADVIIHQDPVDKETYPTRPTKK